MNDWQLYDLYESIPLTPTGPLSTFEEFIDKLYEDSNFKNVILNKNKK